MRLAKVAVPVASESNGKSHPGRSPEGRFQCFRCFAVAGLVGLDLRTRVDLDDGRESRCATAAVNLRVETFLANQRLLSARLRRPRRRYGRGGAGRAVRSLPGREGAVTRRWVAGSSWFYVSTGATTAAMCGSTLRANPGRPPVAGDLSLPAASCRSSYGDISLASGSIPALCSG
jgi:hypothetical protein